MARKKPLPIKFIIARTISNALIIGAVVYLGLSALPIIKAEASYRFNRLRGIRYVIDEGKRVPGENQHPGANYFLRLAKEPPPIKVKPVSYEFGIVIEKIGVNAPVVADVESSNYEEYMEALKHGVAHAKGTKKPGEVGNTYIHGHSTLNFWQMGKYATVFTLLNKVGEGDRIITFYKGKRYDYKVVKKEIFPGYDITPLLRHYDEPILTLQTCDPPGTTLNRLIVTAKLIT